MLAPFRTDIHQNEQGQAQSERAILQGVALLVSVKVDTSARAT
jgi:hypothetical protein